MPLGAGRVPGREWRGMPGAAGAAVPDEADGPPTPDALRAALGHFPTGVTVVTAEHRGRRVAMTANSFASVSLDPPLVLWSAAKSASSHATFLAADAFAVHFLGAEHGDLALHFAKGAAKSTVEAPAAGPAGDAPDKFATVAHAPGLTGAPLLDGVAPFVECRVWARYPGGDHTILVGEVVRLAAERREPLLFHGGALRPMGVAHAPPARLPQGFARTYLAYLLARASQTISDTFHAELPRFGLSVPEWRVMACLVDEDGLGVGELAAMSIMKQPRMTKLLDRMAAQALVERRADPRDRRRALIHLTARGRAAVRPVLAAARAHEGAVLAPFSEAERAVIKQALDLLIGEGPRG